MLQVRLLSLDGTDPNFGPYLADRFTALLHRPEVVLEHGETFWRIVLPNTNYAIVSEAVSLPSGQVVVESADALADDDFHTSPVT